MEGYLKKGPRNKISSSAWSSSWVLFSILQHEVLVPVGQFGTRGDVCRVWSRFKKFKESG